MVRAAIARISAESSPDHERELYGFAGAPPSYPYKSPAISNARLGLFILLGAEAMFFAGLIGSFLVFRLGSEVWPPVSQPRLPLGVTGINTIVLLLSGWAAHIALNAIRKGKSTSLLGWLGSTAVLGFLFLCVQGYEWVRLVHFGLTISSGIYGSTFYTLIGFHGLHVLIAVIWLLVVLERARCGHFTAGHYVGVEIFTLYWTFVVGLWPLLYILVYLI